MTSTNDINEKLLLASKEGDLEAVKSLLAQGADVNVADKEGATGASQLGSEYKYLDIYTR
ncbi:MAG: hypothetical protein EBE86_025175 [Hormoscilla sp. GUM202]|nr:hypothetical protein [Hormoscilla sp. GUM202]